MLNLMKNIFLEKSALLGHQAWRLRIKLFTFFSCNVDGVLLDSKAILRLPFFSYVNNDFIVIIFSFSH